MKWTHPIFKGRLESQLRDSLWAFSVDFEETFKMKSSVFTKKPRSGHPVVPFLKKSLLALFSKVATL